MAPESPEVPSDDRPAGLRRLVAAPRRPLLFSTLAALAIVLAGQLSTLQRSLDLNDDNLYLLTTALRIDAPEAVERQDARVLEGYARTQAEENLVYRWHARADYSWNYALLTASLWAVEHLLGPPPADDPDAVPGYVARWAFAGYALAAAVVAVLSVAALASLRSVLVLAAFAIAMGSLALIESSLFEALWSRAAGEPFRHGEVTLVAAEAPLRETLRFLLSPGYGYTPLGFLGRCHFALGLVVAFALRWHARLGPAYAALLALAFVHQSMMGLLLGTLVLVDLAIRPRALLRRSVWPVVAVAGVVYLLRESIFEVLASPVVAGLVLALAVVAWLLLGRRPREETVARLRRAVERWLAPRRGFLARSDRTASAVLDLGVLLSALLVTLPLGVLVNAILPERETMYFWSQVHGRLLGALRPSVAFGLALVGLALAWRAAGRHARVALGHTLRTVAVVVCAACAWDAARSPGALARMRAFASELDRGLATPIQQIDGPDEARVYYAVGKTVLTGTDFVGPLLRLDAD